MINREIKFRAWHNRANKMLESSSNRQIFSWQDEGQDITIMQFIGLLDKNMKEVFERDIVEKEGKFYTITWNNLHACWGLYNSGGQSNEEIMCDISDNYGNSPKEWKDSSLTVIGNIFENPELLKT